MGKALYRTYRSRKLSEIVGQEHVTTLLANALKTDRVAHAYLFTGPRGVGKTSIARILAHEINGLPYTDESMHLDIIEIDAASNNGVDDIRDLREKVNLAPSSAKKKVYIIDEVHMLSKPAFNALLKTLEEPPEHVVFILATTDADKLPETIISRTQRHTFKRASNQDLVKNLQNIAKSESITIDPQALELIAEHSDGSYRDSVSLLDQLASSSNGEAITPAVIEQSLGLAPARAIDTLLDAALSHDYAGALAGLKQLEDRGVQAKIIADQLMAAIRKRSVDEPQLLLLLDSLLLVSQSSFPSAKLLAVVGSFAAPEGATQKPQSRAEAVSAQAPVEVIKLSEAPKRPKEIIPELEKKAEETTPKDDLVPKTAKKPTAMNSTSPASVDTSALLAAAKQRSIGLHSVLKQSSFELKDNTLTIYAKNLFNKNKLETAKQLRCLREALEEQGFDDTLGIVSLAQSIPPKSSHAKAVAAIMGGGEEVSVESLN